MPSFESGSTTRFEAGFELPPELANLPGIAPLVLAFLWELPWFTDPARLLDATQEFLNRKIEIAQVHLIYAGFSASEPPQTRHYPPASVLPTRFWREDSPLLSWFRHGSPEWLEIKKNASVPSDATDVERAAIAELQPLAPVICFPLKDGDALAGFLLAGHKLDGALLFEEERRWIKLLAKNLGNALSRLRLADDLELLGRVSRGLAHDLSDLLTSVSTFFQISSLNGLSSPKLPALLPTASANLTAAQKVLQHAVALSRGHLPEMREINLRHVAEQAAEAVAPLAAERAVKVALACSETVTVIGDEVLILRLFINLMSNALAASPSGETVRLEAAPIAGDDGFIEVRIVDQGSGITLSELMAAEDVALKETGPARPGKTRGLGLAICRRIINWHGGGIEFKGGPGKGTSVVMKLRVH